MNGGRRADAAASASIGISAPAEPAQLRGMLTLTPCPGFVRNSVAQLVSCG